jgi:fibronectin-binding autotransporter adhesin
MLSVGDISFIAAEADANGAVGDGVTIVTWAELSAGTVIKFTDNGMANAGATAANNSEHAWTFTVGATSIMSGTTLNFGFSSPTASRWNGPGSGITSLNLGPEPTGTANSGISSSGDQIFIYQGSGAGSNIANSPANAGAFTGTLVSGINFGPTIVTGNPDSNATYAPTSLVNGNAYVNGGNFDNGYYNGVRSGLTNTLYRAATNNVSNFTFTETLNAVYDRSTSFTINAAASIHWDANGTTTGDGGAGTWDTTTSDRFKNGASGTTYSRWVNSSTGNNHTAVFGGTAGTVSVASGGVTASGLRFDTTGYVVQNNTVTLSGSTTPAISVGTGLTATINSAIAGTQGFEKTGTGILVLGGAQDGMTVTGITVSEGALRAGASDVNFIPSAGILTVAAGATVDLNGWGESIAGLAGAGTITTGAATTNVRFGVGDTNATTTFDGLIENGSGSIYLEKNGTGTLTLTNTLNSFSGTVVAGSNNRTLPTTVHLTAGKLAFTSNGALGVAGGDLYLDGGSLDADALVFDTDGITLDAGRTLNVNNFTSVEVGTGRTGTVAGAVWGDDNDGSTIGGNDTIRKTGAGTLVLTGSTDQIDEIFVAAGTMRAETALDAARVSVSGGAFLQFGNDNALGDLNGTTATVVNDGTVRFQRTGSFTFDNAISGGGAVVNQGGTTTLTASNSYTGVTDVNDGALLVNGNQSAANGLVTVASGATLGGNGTTGGDTTITGTLSTGSSAAIGTVGDLTFAGATTDLTFASGSAWLIDIVQGATDNADTAVVGGVLALGSSLLDPTFSFTGTYTVGTRYTLATYGSRMGAFTSYLDNTVYTLGGVGGGDYLFRYNDSGAISLTAVPEPGTLGLLGAAAGGFFLRRLRRRKSGTTKK